MRPSVSRSRTRAVRQLAATYRMALTGTPVENRLSELWSIMEFLNPRYLGPAATFRKRFAIPIERYQDEERRAKLRRMVAPFVLRRLKTDPRIIQDLPEKQRHAAWVMPQGARDFVDWLMGPVS